MVLSRRLREETRQAHTAAERSGIMQSLLRGTITSAQYLALLQQLQLLYAALESALVAQGTHPALAFIDRDALARSDSLRRDISFLDPSLGQASATPATAAYVSRLAHLNDNAPFLLGAHAYVRYLGDLSGGQILGRIVRKALQLTDAHGTEFYEFPTIDDHAAFKQAFREGLDTLRLSNDEANAYVEEALLGFRLHEQLFQELSPTVASNIDSTA